MDIATQIILTLLGLAGVAISFIGLPGIFLVYLAFILVGFITQFSAVSVTTLIVLGVIVLISTFVDNIAMILGANKFGGSKWGMIGAIVGALLGFFVLGPIGMILGALVGAFVAEFIVYRDVNQAGFASIGTFIGFLAGTIIKAVIAVAVFVWLLFVVW